MQGEITLKEFIEINDKNGNVKTAEVVFRYNDVNNNLYYILYQYNDEVYAAKYDNVLGLSNLDTNLSDEELNMLQKIFNDMAVN